MAPTALLVLLSCAWALTNWWLLPLSKERWTAAGTYEKAAKAGSLVVIEKIRDLCAIGGVAVAILLVVLWLAGLLAGSPTVAPAALLATLNSLHATAKSVSDGYGTLLGILSLGGAGVSLYYAAKYARQRVMQAWMAKADEVYARLNDDTFGTLEQAKKYGQLKVVAERVEAILDAFRAHDDAVRLDAAAARESAEQGTTEAADDAPAATILEPATIEALRNELSDHMVTLSVELARHEVEFERAIARPAGEERSSPPSISDRLVRALSSEAFSKDMGLVRRPLGYVVTGLLFVSLFSWASAPIEAGLQPVLNRLEVNAMAQDSQQALDSALGTADIQEPPSRDENVTDTQAAQMRQTAQAAQIAARLMARQLSRELLHAGTLDRVAGNPRSAPSQLEFVRATISQSQIEASPLADDAARVRKEVAEAAARIADDAPDARSALEQHIEKHIAPHMEQLQRDKPNRFNALLARLESRYSGPVAPLDAQARLMSRVFDEALGGLDVRPGNEIGKQAQRLVKEFGKESVKTWVNAAANAYVKDAILDPVRMEVQSKAAGKYAFKTSEDLRAFAERLQESEGKSWAGSEVAKQEGRMYQAVANGVAESDPGASRAAREALAERLGGYDNLFPSGGGGGGGGGGERHGPPRAAAPHGPSTSTFARSRATNVHLASRSFRVRGVLIGQELQGPPLDVADIRWTLAGPKSAQHSRIAIDLRLSGKWVPIGTFNAAAVNQALRYAADSRVVATTITAGGGPIGRVTYLHPSLTDTPLGCRVVEADRFVDTFSFDPKGKPIVPAFAQLRADRMEMGRWLSIMNLAERVALDPSDKCPREVLDKVVAKNQDALTRVRFTPELNKAMDRFLSDSKTTSGGSTELLRKATACATGEAPLAECLCKNVKPVDLTGKYWYPEDHTSQVRERQAPLSSDLAWLRPSADRLGHLDLWVHTTFAVRRMGGDAEESTATPLDFPAVQLSALRAEVSARLPAYLKASLATSYDDFMAPLEEFILVQRLARAAFEGKLGTDFPVARFIALEQQTRSSVPTQSTVKWEPARNGEKEFMAMLRRTDAQAERTYVRWSMEQAARQIAQQPRCDAPSK